MRNQLLFTALLAAAVVLLAGCGEKTPPLAGLWRGEFDINGHALPFEFELVDADEDGQPEHLVLINGEERVEIDVQTKGDSLLAYSEVFDTKLVATPTTDGLTGYYDKAYRNLRINFKARPHPGYRFAPGEGAPAQLAARYSLQFEDAQDASVGIFQQEGDLVTGSILNTTGDYRYLAGRVRGDSLLLSTFDGAHVFLFTAKLEGDKLEGGTFYSSLEWEQGFTATADPAAALPNPESLTYLKEGYDGLAFAFPDARGDTIRLSDSFFEGQVTLVQIMGSWCPNCLDESRFLADWYRNHRDQPVRIVALAFEADTLPAYALPRLAQYQKALQLDYPVLLAGPSDKELASQKLPALNAVIAFPTLIFIDKQGRVRHIHTGFSGPATGKAYADYKEEFELRMEKLLAEPGPARP